MAKKKLKKQRPEALATFAESARSRSKTPTRSKLTATKKTAPMATSSKRKDKAATKVLREGVYRRDEGADEAIAELPDRVISSRE
jgi:hypothetical protein